MITINIVNKSWNVSVCLCVCVYLYILCILHPLSEEGRKQRRKRCKEERGNSICPSAKLPYMDMHMYTCTHADIYCNNTLKI